MKLRIFGVIVCAVLLLVPVAAMSAPAGPPEGLDVKIVDQPVEVTGDVNATVSGDVEVTNGTNNPVPVTGDVKVVNDDASPVPVKMSNNVVNIGEPFHERLWTFGDYKYKVPDGYRLKITHISISQVKNNDYDNIDLLGALLDVGFGYYGLFAPFSGPFPMDGYAEYRRYIYSSPFECIVDEGHTIMYRSGNLAIDQTPNGYAEIVGILIPLD